MALPAAAALALVGAATACLIIVNRRPHLVPLVYIIPVVIAATRWGTLPGLVAAIAGAAAADFFFYPPVYSFWLDNRRDVIDLLLYLFVAIVTSNLAARLRNEANRSSGRAKEISELHAFSRGLATCLTSREIVFAVQVYLSDALGHRAFLVSTSSAHGDPDADGAAVPDEVRREAVKLSALGRRAPVTVKSQTKGVWLIKIVVAEPSACGAIAVEIKAGSLKAGAKENIAPLVKRVEMALDEAAQTLDHLKVKEAVEQAGLNYRTEILRDALVGGISHELRTPLASVLGACSVLNEIAAIREDGRSRALVEVIHDQATHLDDVIRDLLDASRVNARGIQPQLMWTDPTDIVTSAVKLKQRRLTDHKVALDVPRDVPFVYVDPVLIEQALGQLLDNAAKYAPTGTEITVSSLSSLGYVDLTVTDQGSGLTDEDKSELGKRCYRGERHTAATGSGLGLWIASTFVAANGGSLFAESRGPGLGTTMSLRLPTVCENAPELVDDLND